MRATNRQLIIRTLSDSIWHLPMRYGATLEPNIINSFVSLTFILFVHEILCEIPPESIDSGDVEILVLKIFLLFSNRNARDLYLLSASCFGIFSLYSASQGTHVQGSQMPYYLYREGELKKKKKKSYWTHSTIMQRGVTMPCINGLKIYTCLFGGKIGKKKKKKGGEDQ